MAMAIVDTKNHTIIGTKTRMTLMCGVCGKTWEDDSEHHRPTCPHCKACLPAWGLPQNPFACGGG